MNALEKLIRRGADGIRAAVERARQRVITLACRKRHLGTADFLTLARAQLVRHEPVIARAIEAGTMAAWLASARATAREAATAAPNPVPLLPPPLPPGFQPLAPRPLGEPPRVRFPAIEAAVSDLNARRVLQPGDFQVLAADARNAAFTVARATTEDAVDAVRAAVIQTVERGLSLPKFRLAVADALEDSGLTPSQIETVYRTQTGLAHAAGLRAVLSRPLVGDEFPYVAWHATHDGRVRPDHLAMEQAGIGGGNVYRCDDPALRAVWPPCSFNCRCVVVPLSVEDAADAGVSEAQTWLRTGSPPERPAWVGTVPVKVPRGWPVPDGGRVPAVV